MALCRAKNSNTTSLMRRVRSYIVVPLGVILRHHGLPKAVLRQIQRLLGIVLSKSSAAVVAD